jgi:hypothetical protein
MWVSGTKSKSDRRLDEFIKKMEEKLYLIILTKPGERYYD